MRPRRPDGPFLVAVMGPTASGKTELAEAVADRLDAALLNADAFQIYRGLDIGTAKPERRDRYSLLDILDPDRTFGVGAWIELASAELLKLWEQRRSAVVVGGTGLYIRALFERYSQMGGPPDPAVRAALIERERTVGSAALAEELRTLDPELASRTDLRNPVRVRRALERQKQRSPSRSVHLPPFVQVKTGIDVERDVLGPRIEARVEKMLQAGWIEEVRSLERAGFGIESPGFRAIGYRVVSSLARGEVARADAVEAIVRATTQYAKRQRTWMRAEPRLMRIESDGRPRVENVMKWISQARGVE